MIWVTLGVIFVVITFLGMWLYLLYVLEVQHQTILEEKEEIEELKKEIEEIKKKADLMRTLLQKIELTDLGW